MAAQLHYEEASSTQWQDRFRTLFNNFGQFVINPNAEYWQAFEARWDSGGACTAVLSTHSPQSCLLLVSLRSTPPLGTPFNPCQNWREGSSFSKLMSFPEIIVNYLFLDASGPINSHRGNPIFSPGRLQLFRSYRFRFRRSPQCRRHHARSCPRQCGFLSNRYCKVTGFGKSKIKF